MTLTRVNTNPRFWFWYLIHRVSGFHLEVAFEINHYSMKKIIALTGKE
jgi:hypothetical protein